MNAEICDFFFLMPLAKVPKTQLEVDCIDVRIGFLIAVHLLKCFHAFNY